MKVLKYPFITRKYWRNNEHTIRPLKRGSEQEDNLFSSLIRVIWVSYKIITRKKNHIKCTPGVEIHYLFLKFYEKFCLQKTNINVLPYIKKNQVCYILCLFEETTRIARMESFWTPLVLIIVLLKGMFLVIKSNYVKHIVLCFISWF
jgi:hypothetical protein